MGRVDDRPHRIEQGPSKLGLCAFRSEHHGRNAVYDPRLFSHKQIVTVEALMVDIEASVRGSLSHLRDAERTLASHGRADTRPAELVRLEMQSLLAIVRECHYRILELSEFGKQLGTYPFPDVATGRSLSADPDDVIL